MAIVVKLDVCHPCCCEKQCVEVCLPACCTGEPCVYDRCTLVGCGATVYEWDCGVRVVVRYWRNGDITVKSVDFYKTRTWESRPAFRESFFWDGKWYSVVAATWPGHGYDLHVRLTSKD